MAFKPWLTSRGLIESIKRKGLIPISQNTFSEVDLLRFANEEMMISAVPSIMEYHEEYFVYRVEMDLVSDLSRYPIPDRAIGMKLRDLMFKDEQDNLRELTRISPEDKAYWQSRAGSFNAVYRFYIEGNDVVFTPDSDFETGSVVFGIYLRPNQLVLDERACICQNFVKIITATSVLSGDTITIDGTTLTAGTDFTIGASDTITATNISSAINTADLATASSATNIITLRYDDVSLSISSSNDTTLAVQSTQGIEFDQVPPTYLNPETNITEDLFADGEQVDFLQTKPGHRTYSYDITIPTGGIVGSIINFESDDIPTTFIIGDYICLANECIIPQIPPDLHNGLAERTCARIMASLGDQAGLQTSMAKIQEIEQKQGPMLMNRAEGAPLKVTGRNSLLRNGRRGPWG